MVQFFSSSSQIITPTSRTSIQTIRRPRHSQEAQTLDQQIPQPTSFSQKTLPIISCSFKFIQPSKSLANSKQSSSPLLPLLFGIAFHLQLVLLSYHPIFLRPYHFLKLVSFLGANRTKSASVCLWLLRG